MCSSRVEISLQKLCGGPALLPCPEILSLGCKTSATSPHLRMTSAGLCRASGSEASGGNARVSGKQSSGRISRAAADTSTRSRAAAAARQCGGSPPLPPAPPPFHSRFLQNRGLRLAHSLVSTVRDREMPSIREVYLAWWPAHGAHGMRNNPVIRSKPLSSCLVHIQHAITWDKSAGGESAKVSLTLTLHPRCKVTPAPTLTLTLTQPGRKRTAATGAPARSPAPAAGGSAGAAA